MSNEYSGGAITPDRLLRLLNSNHLQLFEKKKQFLSDKKFVFEILQKTVLIFKAEPSLKLTALVLFYYHFYRTPFLFPAAE